VASAWVEVPRAAALERVDSWERTGCRRMAMTDDRWTSMLYEIGTNLVVRFGGAFQVADRTLRWDAFRRWDPARCCGGRGPSAAVSLSGDGSRVMIGARYEYSHDVGGGPETTTRKIQVSGLGEATLTTGANPIESGHYLDVAVAAANKEIPRSDEAGSDAILTEVVQMVVALDGVASKAV
jgi:hypothetical protein